MIMKDRIARSRIWLLAAGAASISIASWSFAHAAYGAGSAQAQNRGAKASPSAGAAGDLATGARLMLRDGWQVQTSSNQPDGAVISKTGFAASGWFSTAVPATVCGVLAQARGGRGNGVPQNNPFAVGWWFRTEFDLPAEMAGRAITLHLEGINYRAEV